MRTPLLSAGDANWRLGITRSHTCSAMRCEITNVWISCRTAAGESACSSWMTDSMGSNLTRSLYFMATLTPSAGGAGADRDDDGLGLFALDELRMARFGVGQCPLLVTPVPGGDD